MSTLVSSFQFITSFLWAPPRVTQFFALSQTFVKVRSSCDPFVPFDFIASFLWAPPVATQFSVVRAPPVGTLVITFHRSISVRTACGDSAFSSWSKCVVKQLEDPREISSCSILHFKLAPGGPNVFQARSAHDGDLCLDIFPDATPGLCKCNVNGEILDYVFKKFGHRHRRPFNIYTYVQMYIFH